MGAVLQFSAALSAIPNVFPVVSAFSIELRRASADLKTEKNLVSPIHQFCAIFCSVNEAENRRPLHSKFIQSQSLTNLYTYLHSET